MNALETLYVQSEPQKLPAPHDTKQTSPGPQSASLLQFVLPLRLSTQADNPETVGLHAQEERVWPALAQNGPSQSGDPAGHDSKAQTMNVPAGAVKGAENFARLQNDRRASRADLSET